MLVVNVGLNVGNYSSTMEHREVSLSSIYRSDFPKKKTSSYWGTPMTMETPICARVNTQVGYSHPVTIVFLLNGCYNYLFTIG